MITPETGIIALYAIGQIVGTIVIGARVARIEKTLGNGESGVFPRRAEVELIVMKAIKEHVNGEAP